MSRTSGRISRSRGPTPRPGCWPCRRPAAGGRPPAGRSAWPAQTGGQGAEAPRVMVRLDLAGVGHGRPRPLGGKRESAGRAPRGRRPRCRPSAGRTGPARRARRQRPESAGVEGHVAVHAAPQVVGDSREVVPIPHRPRRARRRQRVGQGLVRLGRPPCEGRRAQRHGVGDAKTGQGEARGRPSAHLDGTERAATSPAASGRDRSAGPLTPSHSPTHAGGKSRANVARPSSSAGLGRWQCMKVQGLVGPGARRPGGSGRHSTATVAPLTEPL